MNSKNGRKHKMDKRIKKFAQMCAMSRHEGLSIPEHEKKIKLCNELVVDGLMVNGENGFTFTNEEDGEYFDDVIKNWKKQMPVKELQERIDLVKNDILHRFPNCSYTINILLWDDGTSRVDCRHGNADGTKIHITSVYNNEVSYNEIDIDGRVMIKDEFGNEHYKYLVDKK